MQPLITFSVLGAKPSKPPDCMPTGGRLKPHELDNQSREKRAHLAVIPKKKSSHVKLPLDSHECWVVGHCSPSLVSQAFGATSILLTKGWPGTKTRLQLGPHQSLHCFQFSFYSNYQKSLWDLLHRANKDTRKLSRRFGLTQNYPKHADARNGPKVGAFGQNWGGHGCRRPSSLNVNLWASLHLYSVMHCQPSVWSFAWFLCQRKQIHFRRSSRLQLLPANPILPNFPRLPRLPLVLKSASTPERLLLPVGIDLATSKRCSWDKMFGRLPWGQRKSLDLIWHKEIECC